MFGGKGYNLATSAKGGMTMGLYSCPNDSYSDICIDIASSTVLGNTDVKGLEEDSMRGHRENNREEC